MSSVQSQPQSRGRNKVRIPLDHPDTEQLEKRIRTLISSGALTDDECGQLIKKERELRKVDYRLARRLFDAPLPMSPLRPIFWDDYHRPFSGVFGCPELDVWAGWIARLREYIERLEQKYFGHRITALDASEIGSDDI